MTSCYSEGHNSLSAGSQQAAKSIYLIVCQRMEMELLLLDEVIHRTLTGSKLAVVHLHVLQAADKIFKLLLGAAVSLPQPLSIPAV